MKSESCPCLPHICPPPFNFPEAEWNIWPLLPPPRHLVQLETSGAQDVQSYFQEHLLNSSDPHALKHYATNPENQIGAPSYLIRQNCCYSLNFHYLFTCTCLYCGYNADRI